MVGHTPLAVLRVLLMASVIAVVGTFVAAPAICFGLLVKKARWVGGHCS